MQLRRLQRWLARRTVGTRVDHVPVLVREPPQGTALRGLVVHLPPFTSTKERTEPELAAYAAAGYVAVGLDPWQHGARAVETAAELRARVFAGFYRHMWPILGQTTLDLLRVIDWGVARYAPPRICLSGLSMGGDIAVAAGRLDPRIAAIVAVAATPDWRRPGMRDPDDRARLLDPGPADAYARTFCDLFDPISHVGDYAEGPAIRFVCGGRDTMVSPEAAHRFQAALGEGARVEIITLADADHRDLLRPARWLDASLDWFARA